LEKEKLDLMADLERIRQERTSLTEENRRCMGRIEELHGRVERQNQELADLRTLAQEFASKANSISGADVCRAVMDLDSEIFQTAASLSSCSLEFRSQYTKSTAVPSEIHERMARILGPTIVDLILEDRRSKSGSAMLVQIALQAAITDWVYVQIYSWASGRDSESVNYFLDGLYEDIRRSGECRMSLYETEYLTEHRDIHGRRKMEGDDTDTTHRESERHRD
jgi:hypothetical protein